MEQQTANSVSWINPRLECETASALSACLHSLVGVGIGKWAWLLERSKANVTLLASVGKTKPHRTSWQACLPSGKCSLDSRQIYALSPFHSSIEDFGSLRSYEIGSGYLISDCRLEPNPKVLASLELNWRLLIAQREAINLRKKVQRLSAKLEENHRIAQKLKPTAKIKEKKAEALSFWYHKTSELLSSPQLASTLQKLAGQAQQLLEVDLAAIMILDNNQVRLWSNGIELPLVLSLEQLGTLGRKAILKGERYLYQHPGKPSNRFFAKIGLSSALTLPLAIEDKALGAILLGHRTVYHFSTEEIDLAKLIAYQIALLLENSLLATGVNVERVVARSVLESMADGVLTLDWEKRITSFNPAAEQITGWSASDAIGKTYSEVTKARYPASQGGAHGGCDASCPLLTILASQELMHKGLNVQGTIERKDGEIRHVSSTFSIITNREDLLGSVILFRDVTKQYELERLKSEYAAELTHDLKTPLTSIKGYAITLLRKGQKLSEASRMEALEVINFEIDRVSRMLDNLLRQARLEAGVREQNLSLVHPLSVIKQIASLYSYSGCSHAFTYEVVPEDLKLTTDRDQLDQILNNLASNAVKYSPDGSIIVIRCGIDTTHQEMIRFEVIDSGLGIPEEELALIFEKFHRTKKALASTTRGTGLGLYITKMLVESLGGEIGATSKLGKGSCFWFLLPKN